MVVKLWVVATSGISAAPYARAHTTAGLTVSGALAGASAPATVFLGTRPARPWKARFSLRC